MKDNASLFSLNPILPCVNVHLLNQVPERSLNRCTGLLQADCDRGSQKFGGGPITIVPGWRMSNAAVHSHLSSAECRFGGCYDPLPDGTLPLTWPRNTPTASDTGRGTPLLSMLVKDY